MKKGAYLHDPSSSQRTGVPLNQACCSGLWSWRANLEPYVRNMFKQWMASCPVLDTAVDGSWDS